jgi:hypothetical protein
MLQKLIRPRVSAVVAPVAAALTITSTFMAAPVQNVCLCRKRANGLEQAGRASILYQPHLGVASEYDNR